MENLNLQEIVEEICDAVENEVPNEIIIQWLNGSPLSDEEMDELVGMLEQLEEFRIIAGLIADEIESPTLTNDIARNQPWFKNDRCNRHPADELRPAWDKKWLQRWKEVMPDNCDIVVYPRKPKIWRTDI